MKVSLKVSDSYFFLLVVSIKNVFYVVFGRILNFHTIETTNSLFYIRPNANCFVIFFAIWSNTFQIPITKPKK